MGAAAGDAVRKAVLVKNDSSVEWFALGTLATTRNVGAFFSATAIALLVPPHPVSIGGRAHSRQNQGYQLVFGRIKIDACDEFADLRRQFQQFIVAQIDFDQFGEVAKFRWQRRELVAARKKLGKDGELADFRW